MKKFEPGKKAKIVRGNGEIEIGTLLECTTNNKKDLEIINSNTNKCSHLWSVKIDGNKNDGLWSERRMVLI